MTSRILGSDELARTWEERPDIIREFIEIRPHYEQLCHEIEYILRKRLDNSAIEYSAITSRAKTLKSFAEKLSRKHYDDPLRDVTDLAGVRLVYLYKSDRSAIEKIIESEFDVVEKLDKVEEQEPDKFGYGALHYLIHIGRQSSGARYDDLKGMVCEIQVRTVLQDAWAIIDHHLSYKQEADVPKILKRKLNSVSGLFETADDQFDRIRAEREQYKELVKSKLDTPDSFLEQDINLDTLIEFLKWKFPSMDASNDDKYLSDTLAQAIKYGYMRLVSLNSLLDKTEAARVAITAEKPLAAATGQIVWALALTHPEFVEATNWDESWRSLIEKYKHLIPDIE